MSQADRQKWDDRHRLEGGTPRAPSSFVVSIAALLPMQGRALDVAGGTGRHALWLAQRRLEVTLADISEVALEIAQNQAASVGVPLRTLVVDFEADGLPNGPWDIIVCVDYLWRPLFEAFPQVLVPGGLLVVSQPTLTNLQRHGKPGPRFLLEDGELRGLVRGLEILRFEEGWMEEGRHVARVVARRGQGGRAP